MSSTEREPAKPLDMSVDEWKKFCIDMAFLAIKRDPRNEDSIIKYWKAAMRRID